MFDENINFNEENIAEENVGNAINPEELIEEQTENIPETRELTETEEKAKEPPTFFRIPEPTPEELEKRSIKRVSQAVGVSFLVFYWLRWLLNLDAILIAKVFIPSYNEVINLLQEPAIQQVQQILFSLSVFTIPFILVFRFYNYRISDLLSFKAPKGRNNFFLFLIGISFCSFANIASSLAERVFYKAGISYEVDFGDSPEGVFGFLLSLIATVIVPALIEEFACRGIMLSALKKHGEAFAIITSSALFGLMHSNFEQIPFAFLVGLVLGYITIKSASIWIAVFVHAFNNLISVVYIYLLSGLSGIAQNISYTIFLIVCLLLGLFAITKISKEENIFKLNEDMALTGINKRLKWFFLSVPIIIYAILCILQSLNHFN